MMTRLQYNYGNCACGIMGENGPSVRRLRVKFHENNNI